MVSALVPPASLSSTPQEPVPVSIKDSHSAYAHKHKAMDAIGIDVEHSESPKKKIRMGDQANE